MEKRRTIYSRVCQYDETNTCTLYITINEDGSLTAALVVGNNYSCVGFARIDKGVYGYWGLPVPAQAKVILSQLLREF